MRHALYDFVDAGAVAQLGERQNRTLEAGGSIPLCSTNDFNWLDEYSGTTLAKPVFMRPGAYPRPARQDFAQALNRTGTGQAGVTAHRRCS